MPNKESKALPTTFESYALLFIVIAVIVVSLAYSLELVSALFFGCIVAALGHLYIHRSWDRVQQDMIKGIANGLGAILILMIIGSVIGVWIASGTIPTLIIYGLRLIRAEFFLPTGFFLASLISILIGSSFGTIATIGIVLMGIGEVLNVNPAITAGVVVSGAMLGDQISPLSDSTNLTASITAVKLMDHVRSMFRIAIPSAIIAMIIYFVINSQTVSSNPDINQIQDLIESLSGLYHINILNLTPIIVVVVLLMLKIPAIPALTLSYLVASLIAMILQGVSFAEIIDITANGVVSNSGHELIDGLLTQGGVTSMLGTIAIILFGTAMGGILEGSQILEVILDSFLKVLHNTVGLVFFTLLSGYLMLAATGEMYVSIILPGKILGQAYDQMNVDRTQLSRAIEASATLGCGMLPWGIVTKYAMDVLGVGYEFIPFSVIPIIVPLLTLGSAVINQMRAKAV